MVVGLALVVAGFAGFATGRHAEEGGSWPVPQIRYHHNASTAISHVIRSGGGELEQDCFYLDTPPSHATNQRPSPLSIRMTGCHGRPPFTLVTEEDTAELSPSPSDRSGAKSVRVAYYDVNNDGKYGLSDALYLTTAAAPQLAAPSQNDFTLRLTTLDKNRPAGALVKTEDSDFIHYRDHAPTLSSSLVFVDDDANAQFSDSDAVYLLPGTPPGRAAGSIVPEEAIPLHEEYPFRYRATLTPIARPEI